MAKEIPSVGDLRRKSEITDAEIEAATDGYMEDESTTHYIFNSVSVLRTQTAVRRFVFAATCSR